MFLHLCCFHIHGMYILCWCRKIFLNPDVYIKSFFTTLQEFDARLSKRTLNYVQQRETSHISFLWNEFSRGLSKTMEPVAVQRESRSKFKITKAAHHCITLCRIGLHEASCIHISIPTMIPMKYSFMTRTRRWKFGFLKKQKAHREIRNALQHRFCSFYQTFTWHNIIK